MKRLALLLALAHLSGCNQVFGLDDTRLVDASHPFFDAPPEPPPGCPPAGTQLVFAAGLTQVVFQNCRQYIPSFTPGSAIAMCEEDNGSFSYGRVDNGLLPAEFDVPCAQLPNSCYQIRSMPEGSDALLSWFEDATLSTKLTRLRRDAEGKWHSIGAFTAPFASSFLNDDWSQPTRGPERRLIVNAPISNPVRELKATEPYDTWVEVDRYTMAQLGTLSMTSPRLTADGLHLVFKGQPPSAPMQQLMIADRASITDRFNPAMTVPGIPLVDDAVLSDDCERLYFYGLESIFYQKRMR
ncbi:MAG TPA: hypothetical protein VL326_16270 [Kofleriaceae bacterium]|jgi:hypothetical protein|nr:hypothetical protein [Kofleriaceae bacterium]